MFYRIRCLILSRKYGGFVCIQDKALRMGNLLTGTVKAGHCSAIVPTVNPFIARAEFAFGKVRFFSYGVNQTFNSIYVHTI